MNTAITLIGKLNDYTLKVNRDMLEHLSAFDTLNERINVLISHSISAHQVWLERMQGKSMSVKVFDIRTYEDLKKQTELNHSETASILAERSLDESISYVNTKRQRFENTIAEMFLHLFNHATYHRGQINQLLVQEGKPAMVSDFIVYNRTEII